MPIARRPRTDNKKFDAFLEGERETIEVRVFLCGQAIDRKNLSALAATRADKRAYLWSRLEKDVMGCKVLLGEHDFLIKTYGKIFQKKGTGTVNLALFEAALARHVHLIVLFPESAGSFAELGLFTAPGGVSNKLMVIVEKKYEGEKSFLNSFLWRGPISKIDSERGHIRFFDYSDLDSIYDAVREVVDQLVEKITAEKIFIKSSV